MIPDLIHLIKGSYSTPYLIYIVTSFSTSVKLSSQILYEPTVTTETSPYLSTV